MFWLQDHFMYIWYLFEEKSALKVLAIDRHPCAMNFFWRPAAIVRLQNIWQKFVKKNLTA